MEKIKECAVCGNTDFAEFLFAKDFTVSDEKFHIVECDSCRFLFTNPRPDEQSIGKYYKSEEYISHTDTKKGLINFLYQIAKKITLRNKLNLINSLVSSENAKSLLDYGCGTGDFLLYCKNEGWLVNGTEPDEGAAKLASGKLNLTVEKPSAFFAQNKSSFSVITLWHVLEHIHQLNETVVKLKSLLNNDGVIIIAVPNKNSFDAEYYGEFWAAYDLPRHLYHFTPDTMKLFASKHGFKIVKQLPMKLDSFYVSMLSEKYRKGSIISAFLTGLKSNLKARKNGNYSSIIYILKLQEAY